MLFLIQTLDTSSCAPGIEQSMLLAFIFVPHLLHIHIAACRFFPSKIW